MESIVEIAKPKIYLIAESRGEFGPEELVVYGANACIKKIDPLSIYKDHVASGIDINQFKERVLNATIGSGHLGVLDQATFTFVIRDVPRITTLFLVSPIYLSHLQQSMRSVEPYGYYIPESIAKSKLYNAVKSEIIRSIKLYYKLTRWGVPKEDARYVIPLYTVTNIQTTGNARELTHLYIMSLDENIPTITKYVINKMWRELNSRYPLLFADRRINMNRIRYYPAPQIFCLKDYIDEVISSLDNIKINEVKLINYVDLVKFPGKKIFEAVLHGDESALSILKLNKYIFASKMSLVTLHQILRQRTWHHITESIYRALKRLEYVTPPSIIQKRLSREYQYQVERLYDLYIKLVNEGVDFKDAVGVISHAHTIIDIFTIDGWNMVSTVPLRRCLKAQWEIRKIMNDISLYIANISKELSQLSLPTCLLQGYCAEKYPCEFKDIFIEKSVQLRKLFYD